MIYYCEVSHIDKPHFDGHKHTADNDAAALQYFKSRWGDKLICVYDEDFRFIYEAY